MSDDEETTCPRLTQRGKPCGYRRASFGDGRFVQYAPACRSHMREHEQALFQAMESGWSAGLKCAALYWQPKLDKAIAERDEALTRYGELAERYDRRRKAPG